MKRTAFSLVELSIVLVILGLLTGGILAGQSLIRAAELRSVSSDVGRYITAVNTFRDKYFALPGDMANATKFWGDDNAVCPDPIITNGTPGTCNGNGNGTIAWSSDTVDYEAFRAWQHLANAGLIEGSYSGIAGGGGTLDAVVGTNVPRGRISNTGFFLRSFSTSGHTDFYDGDYSPSLQFGSDSSVSTYTNGPALKPEEAWNIDTKMDDGKPATGSVRALKPASTFAPGCTNASGEYVLTANTILCPLILNLSR